MSQSRLLHCVFYSHVWSIYQLETLGLLKNAKQPLLVELSVESRFADVFDLAEKRHKGLIELLQPGIQLHKLGYRPRNISAPIVLAANPSPVVDTLVAALSLLPTVDSPIDSTTILIHINDSPQFVDAYPYMSDFSIVWDVADYPNAALLKLAETLSSQQCLSSGKWRGFYLCNHAGRQLSDVNLKISVLQGMLNEFPGLKAA